MKIGIRVDVNQQIATGHVKRDIAIALCLREKGYESLFISADANCREYLKPYNFESVILHSAWNDMEAEVEKIKFVIEEYQIESLLVDSYMVTENYMKQLSDLTYVTYFDELGRMGYGCQQLINGSLEPPDYSKAKGKLLLGPKYVALRQEFSKLPQKDISNEIKKILVTSGGTDNYHFCLNFLEFFLKEEKWKHVILVVAVGELSEDKEKLLQLYSDEKRVEIHINSQNMAKLMQTADYAVTAGGTTLYEICAAGVMASSYAIADNQLDIVESFHKKGLICYAGDFRKKQKETLKNILQQIEAANPNDIRKRKAIDLQSLVDGKGAWRIANELLII